MRDALKKAFWKYHHEHVSGAKKAYERDKLMKVIKSTQGQILITTSQMQWTNDVKLALINYETSGSNTALRQCKKKYLKKVESYVELVEKQ